MPWTQPWARCLSIMGHTHIHADKENSELTRRLTQTHKYLGDGRQLKCLANITRKMDPFKNLYLFYLVGKWHRIKLCYSRILYRKRRRWGRIGGHWALRGPRWSSSSQLRDFVPRQHLTKSKTFWVMTTQVASDLFWLEVRYVTEYPTMHMKNDPAQCR